MTQAPQDPVALLQSLVHIPSVNPDGDPGIPNPGEAACAEAIGAVLAALGATVEYQSVQEGRPNVIGRFPTDRPGKPRFIFAPHTDTVSVVGMTIDPFSGTIHDGRLYGRGASDTKGSLAAMLATLAGLKEEIPRWPWEIWFVGLMGEEKEQYGSHAFVETYCRETPERTFALIGEPTDDQIIHTHKGTCRLRLTTHGRAAHSSSPHLGVNAIEAMIPVLAWLRDELPPRLAPYENPVLGRPSVSIGTLQGGSKVNIVPARCETVIDIRTTPELAKACPSGVGPTLLGWLAEAFPALEGTSVDAAPLWTAPEHPVLQALSAAGKPLGGAPWYCDAAVFSRAGVPAVAAGPGSMDDAHTANESISIAALHEWVAFYRRFLMSMMAHP